MKPRAAFFFGTLAGLILSLVTALIFLSGLNKGVALGLALCDTPTIGATDAPSTW